jgi:putative transposase
MCRVLDVSTSGYYAWRKHPVSKHQKTDAELLERIKHFHKRSDGTYGVPRIVEDLIEEGFHVSPKRVARLMRQAGLRGVCRRNSTWTTRRSPSDRPAADLVDRDFTAKGPNQLWVADITYVPTWAGFLYLSVVLDVWSRRVIGWAMETHLRTDLVVAALDMAIEQRRPTDVIHHSDQGTQYTSLEFGQRCENAGVRPSMGTVGDCYDNAMCESFFATLECERIDRRIYKTHHQARCDIFNYIEGWYNPHRRHKGIGQKSPMNFETLNTYTKPELSTQSV